MVRWWTSRCRNAAPCSRWCASARAGPAAISTADAPSAAAGHGLGALAPAILAGVSFGISDILGKIVFADGAAPLTVSAVRGLLGVAIAWVWLGGRPAARAHTRSEVVVSLFIGVLLAANIYGVLKAIQLVPVPIAILSYFVYPLLTGLAGAALGIEALGWAGATAALAAFAGLALMIGAAGEALAPLGIAVAVAAALTRVAILLLTRTHLAFADPRLTGWYSILGSTVALLAVAALSNTWALPHHATGWGAFAGLTVTSTVSTLALFVSAARIGAFRTALVMNLEPVVSTLLSVIVLGEAITPLQSAGAATMVAALVAFQLFRPGRNRR
ncbi:MAG: DMT family transporter [Rhodospirillales bacterium]|nr:DMT family transporter [Rhodospirillales bacterium]